MRLLLPTLAILLLPACRDEQPPIGPQETDEQYSGGKNFTTFDRSENAFGVQGKNLSGVEDGYFVTGNAFFRNNWVTAPASVQSLDGLGPFMNAISCGSCHFKDGRARPPAFPEEPLNGLLFRLSIPLDAAHGELAGDPVYGGQLQDKAILNVLPEARVRVTYEEKTGYFADGATYTLRQPVYTFYDLNYGDFAPGMMFSPRIAPQMPGLGLLEIVPESVILDWSDPNDSNSDGISGRPNYVWNTAKQQSEIGRFGWKANQPDLQQQTAKAFNGDIGITSNLFPEDHLTPFQQLQYPGIPNGGAPEISDDLLAKVVSYCQTLSVPARRDWTDQQVLRGKFLFTELKCEACHRPSLSTGNGGSIGALKNQNIRPYSDLLLHDMGADLADNRPDGFATSTEWRTAPLWGIGMIPTVNGHSFLLHDGRARNLEEAVLWHGGEAEQSREDYKKLSAEDRAALLRFLESL
ncbi:MAG TPA: di-heme oxidoredictase family protein [Saprospiraceae bacterium]|nr:di-heme oxidoredictase family protein [Saprospiraceae bacterium]